MGKKEATKNNIIRFDWALKYLLRDRVNFEVLEGLLSELLGVDVKIDQILESESNQEDKDDKQNRVDLLTKLTTGEIVIIEFQASSVYDYFSQILFGTSKVVVERMKSGDQYRKVDKVVSVTLMFDDLGEGIDYVYQGKTEFIGRHFGDHMKLGALEKKHVYGNKNYPSEIYPEYYLILVAHFDKRIKDRLDEWIYFLKTECIQPGFKAKGLKAAKDVLDVMKLNQEQRKAYNKYLDNLDHYKGEIHTAWDGGWAGGEAEGLEIGKAEGEKKKEREVIISMNEEKFPLATIARVAKTTVEVVQKVLADL